MENRALLAFALIILIWVGYYYFVVPQFMPPPSTPNAVDDITTPSTESEPEAINSDVQSVPPTENQPSEIVADTPSPSPAQANTTSGQDISQSAIRERKFADSWDRSEKVALLQGASDALTAQDIVVESDLYRGVITTVGGNIKSWQLKEYKGKDGPWVELIPQSRELGPEVILTSEEGPYSFENVVFETSQMSLNLSEAKSQGNLKLIGRTRNGLVLTKEYVFSNDNYAFKVNISIDGDANIPLGSKYYLRWGGGIRITEQDAVLDLQAFRGFAQIGDTVIDEDGLGTEVEEPRPETTGELTWTGVRSKYFLAALIPQDRPGKGYRLNGRPIPAGEIQDRQISAEVSMNLSSPLSNEFLLYLGPVHYETLEMYGVGLENAVDLGWPVISFFSKITLSMLVWLHQFISNYGIVIIVLSVFVKILLYPLTHKSMKATQGMQLIQPKMEALREKYKNDAQKLNTEMMKLYREAGVNPLGGCLPLVLQMPILFALYTVFSSTIELRDAPFIGWITDLSLRDQYFVLPILMGLTMLIQSKMTMKDPRQAMLVYVMPIVLFFIMKDLPSGLILYWTMINILTIIQQFIQNKYLPAKPATA